LISFKNQIKKLSASGYLRTRSVVSSEKSTEVNLNNKLLTSFLSNDYLGMSKNRSVINEIKKSANIHGIGSGSSPLISGYSKSHHYLEKEIAEYLNAEACLVVNSGYMANLCLMDIFDQQMSVIQDRESHNSIIESSKRDKIKINRYKHLDNTHLEKYLDNRNRDIIFSESVFSMTGDTTNIKEHYRLKKKYNSILFIDDAHGFGIAKSTLENCSIENSCSSFNIKVSNVDAYMGTFGKAIGTLGAFVCGSKDLIDMLVQKGRPYIYSTALPRCIIDATRKSLKILVSNKSRYKKLHRNISYFNQGACKKNITIDLTNGPIKTYMVGDPHSALSIQDKFLKEEILVQAIRYPTVPKGHDKIRITITSDHTKKDIDKLLNTLENIHCEKSK
jgi:8-amino-7-oxononanoate synthase